MIKNHKPGDVFYHEPTKQWVRVINKAILCRDCAFHTSEGCIVCNSDAVRCLTYGYVKAERPKNTIHASELTGACVDTFGRQADKATIGDAAGLKSTMKETATFFDSVAHIIVSAFAKSAEATSLLKPTKEFSGPHTKEPKKEYKPTEPQKCWIVCLFFGGKLLPSAMPKQHKSLHSAMTESKRLAKLHDKTFIVFQAELVTQNVRVPMVGCL